MSITTKDLLISTSFSIIGALLAYLFLPVIENQRNQVKLCGDIANLSAEGAVHGEGGDYNRIFTFINIRMHGIDDQSKTLRDATQNYIDNKHIGTSGLKKAEEQAEEIYKVCRQMDRPWYRLRTFFASW